MAFGRVFVFGSDETGLGGVLTQRSSWPMFSLPSRPRRTAATTVSLTVQAARFAPRIVHAFRGRPFKNEQSFGLQASV